LLISRRKRTLEPWLGGEGRRPLLRLGGLTRGFAQSGLERDAEVRGHSALFLLADRVRDRQADARECGAEEYDDRRGRTPTNARLVRMAGHVRDGGSDGGHEAG
jgi:hypothetical protein